MANSVLDRIRELLRSEKVEFRELHHEPTLTSEDSARVRGEDIRVGGKALLLKADDQFKLFVLSTRRRFGSISDSGRPGSRRGTSSTS
jgi:hypothetical protein